MARRRHRYPVTRRMVAQTLHDIFVGAGENKADAGGIVERICRSILVESCTVIENSMRHARERHLASKGGDERVVETLDDIGRDASVPRARVEAAMRGYLSVGAIRAAAAECGLHELLRWIDEEGGAELLEAVLALRHAIIHLLDRGRPEDVAACRAASAVLVRVLDGCDAELVALLLVEGSCMDMVGRVEDARAAYEAALEICRAHMGGGQDAAWAYICAGHALLHLGRDGDAEEAFGDAIRADPASPVPYLELGHLALLDNRPADAEMMYARSAELDPSYAPARVFRGHAMLLQENADGSLAVRQYDGALALDPYEISAPVGIGLAVALQGRHVEAAGHFERAIEIDPEDAAPRAALAHAWAAAGRDSDAIGAFEAAIEAGAGREFRDLAEAGIAIDRTSRFRYRLGGASAHLGLAAVLARSGRREEALARYREAAEIDPRSAKAHAGAGRMLADLGRHEEAIPAYRRAVEIDPGSARAHLGLADSLADGGRHEEAIPAYRRAVEIDPGSARAHLGLADSLADGGRHEEAIPAYRRAVEIDPGSARAHLGLADSLSAVGRYEDAIPEYRRAVEIDPGSARAHLGLADSLANGGSNEDAIPEYRRAVEIDPGSAEAHLGLATALLYAGRGAEAQREYERAEFLARGAGGQYGGASGGWGV